MMANEVDYMAVSPERENGRKNGEGEGGGGEEEELSPSARDALAKRNMLLSHVQFVLQNFAKANKGGKVGGHVGGGKKSGGRDDSLESDFDDSQDDEGEGAMNSSRNWLLSPSKAMRALFPILSDAFAVYADPTTLTAPARCT